MYKRKPVGYRGHREEHRRNALKGKKYLQVSKKIGNKKIAIVGDHTNENPFMVVVYTSGKNHYVGHKVISRHKSVKKADKAMVKYEKENPDVSFFFDRYRKKHDKK